MVGGAGAPGVSVLAGFIGGAAAEGSGLSRMRIDSLCELSACSGWDPARVASGCCECARVSSRWAVARMCVREDEVVESVVDWRWDFVGNRGVAVCV